MIDLDFSITNVANWSAEFIFTLRNKNKWIRSYKVVLSTVVAVTPGLNFFVTYHLLYLLLTLLQSIDIKVISQLNDHIYNYVDKFIIDKFILKAFVQC